MRPEPGDVLAEQLDGPLGGRQFSADDVEQRRLSGTVRANHGMTRPDWHNQAHLVDGLEASEVPRDAFEAKGVDHLA
jgi:hypothetical protein